MRTPNAAAVIAALSLPATALAQAPSPPPGGEPIRRLPETVVTATGVPTDPARIAAGITVIDRRMIEERGYATLAEALTAVPGLRIVQAGSSGQPATAFVRGTNSNHVLVLRDGVPVNDPSTPNGLFNFGNDLLDDVERIEIVRGPLAGLYGSSAIGGVINMITRRGTGAFNGAAEAGGGTQRTVRGSAFAGGETRGAQGALDGMLAGGSISTRGSNIVPPRVATSVGERDQQTAQAITANLGATIGKDTRLGLIARYRRNEASLDNIGSAFGTIIDDRDQSSRNEMATLQGTATTLLLDGRWRTGVSLARIADDRRFRNLPDSADPTLQSDDNRYQGWRTDLQWNNALKLPAPAGFSNAAATFGVQHTRDEAEVRVRSSSSFGPFDQDVDARTHTTGGYVGLQGTVLDRLDLSGGVRYDDPRDFEDQTTWRIGGVWRLPIPVVPLRVSAAYGTGFRTPTLFDRFGTDGFGYQGNPNLRPEKSRGWEGGLAADIDGGVLGVVTLSSTYFYSRIRDLIVTEFSPVYTQVNSGTAIIQGVENEITIAPARWVSLSLTYTWTEAEDGATGLQLARRPRHQGAATLRLLPIPSVVVTPQLVVFGQARENAFARYDDNGDSIAEAGMNPGGALFNLTARWRVVRGWEVFGEGRNLTNSRYEPANGFVVPGRSVLAGLTARW
jgi:vitamin B12 transporter